MHFHGPALPNQNAGVQVTIDGSGPSSPEIGSALISLSQLADIIAGFWYVNLHTTTFGGGEIRGQVVVVPAAPALGGVGLAALVMGIGATGASVVAWRRRSKKG